MAFGSSYTVVASLFAIRYDGLREDGPALCLLTYMYTVTLIDTAPSPAATDKQNREKAVLLPTK